VQRSHSAIGAAVVAGAAMVAAFAFILTNGSSSTTGNGIRTGSISQVGTPAAQPKADPAPTAGSGKADRKPPSSKTAAGRTSPGKTSVTKPTAPPNTGSQSPSFRPGQWIAVVDSYPTDAGMPADQLARSMAAKMIAGGVPARALLASGQYPGLANSNFEPISNTWFVYVGPFSSADAASALCVSSKAQKAYGSLLACPTYEPATAHN
jgi:hypothetical protein